MGGIVVPKDGAVWTDTVMVVVGKRASEALRFASLAEG